MQSIEGSDAGNDDVAPEPELAAWRGEVRRHALAQLVRKPAKPPRLLRVGALALLLLLHVALMLGLRNARRGPPTIAETAVEVRLLAANLPEPPLPVPATSVPHVATTTLHAVARPPAATMAATAGDTFTLRQLLNPDGSIRLPAEPVPYAATKLQISAELMQRGHNLLHCRQTLFANAHARDESVGDGIARKYLAWIGLYNANFAEWKAAQRQADAAAACDG